MRERTNRRGCSTNIEFFDCKTTNFWTPVPENEVSAPTVKCLIFINKHYLQMFCHPCTAFRHYKMRSSSSKFLIQRFGQFGVYNAKQTHSWSRFLFKFNSKHLKSEKREFTTNIKFFGTKKISDTNSSNNFRFFDIMKVCFHKQTLLANVLSSFTDFRHHKREVRHRNFRSNASVDFESIMQNKPIPGLDFS